MKRFSRNNYDWKRHSCYPSGRDLLALTVVFQLDFMPSPPIHDLFVVVAYKQRATTGALAQTNHISWLTGRKTRNDGYAASYTTVTSIIRGFPVDAR